ncbi:uncharacterized protein LOC144918046 isoform X2 [Branchiostoma floridae x Branchiostoma belcheri]
MPPPLQFDHCSFEGNEFKVNINYNNCNFGAPGDHSGTSDEREECANPRADTPSDRSEEFANSRADKSSSLNAEHGSSLSSLPSESETDLKQVRSTGEEERQPGSERPEEDSNDGEEEEEEEAEGNAAAAGTRGSTLLPEMTTGSDVQDDNDTADEDEKWETESKEKEGDGNPRELGDVRLSVDESEGASSASMPAAGQQTWDQPMSLRTTPSAMHRPVTTENNTSSAEQVQEEEPQAQLTAQLLGDLARSDARDTAAQDQIDPNMMARLGRLRGDDIPENTSSIEPAEDTPVNPTGQATGPSNGETCPIQTPHPRIRLQVSPEEPVEGDRVDFELLNVPLLGIGDVVWNHNGRPQQQAAGLYHTIHSVSQNDAGVYQCIVYREKEKINIVAVVEATLNVKKSTDVAGQPYMEEEGGSGGSTGEEQLHPAGIVEEVHQSRRINTGRSGDTSRQTDAPLPDSGNTPGQPTQGSRDHAAETSVLGAVNPDYESLQQRYLQGQKLMKEHEDLSYYPFLKGPFAADLRDCVVMNAGETTTVTTPFDPMLEKLTAVVVAPATPKKKSPPNRTAPLALSIERKDSAPFIRDGSSGRSISGGEIGAADHEMDRPRASGSSDRSGEEPSGSGSSCPPGKRQKDDSARCPDRSPTKPRKLDVPAQPDIDPIYYKIPLSELMDDADLLDEIKYKLDQDSCGRKNWENLGAKFGIPRDQLKHFAYRGRHTEAVLERVSSQSPETSVGDLMDKLYQMKRGDVVDVIKQNMCT